jgi:hypothetical protein
MTISRGRLLAAIAAGILIPPACAQDDGAHWGAQADGGFFNMPRFVVERFHSLPEVPTIDGPSVQAGVVRFNSRGAPNFALQYSQLNVNLDGSISDPRGRASVSGDGTARGFMATKYLNFFTNYRVAAGIALGGGVGAVDASYVRTVSSPTATVFSDRRSYNYTVPLFEINGRVDFRVSRYVTVGPYFGIRNGTLGGGGCVRVHFLK